MNTSDTMPERGWVRAEDASQVEPGLRAAIFGEGEPRPIAIDPEQIRLVRFAAEDWDVLEEALDELPLTTRARVFADECARIDSESASRAEWIADQKRKPTHPRERWQRVLDGHHRRARRADVRSELDLEAWLKVLAASSFQCVYCAAQDADTVDHIIPMCSGGSNAPDNVVPACKRCNVAKSALSLRKWRTRDYGDFETVVQRINAVHVRSGFLMLA